MISKNKPTYGFLILIIGISLLSLSVLLLSPPPSITMANAQVSSGDDNNHRDDGSGTDKQMGICVVGVRSPCNGYT